MHLFNQKTSFTFAHHKAYQAQENDFIFVTNNSGEIYLIDNTIPRYHQLHQHNLEGGYYFGSINDAACVIYFDNHQLDIAKCRIRELGDVLPVELFQATLLANHLTYWLKTHRYCGRCGGEHELRNHEFALQCKRCALVAYPKISPCVIGLIHHGDKILLAKGKNSPTGAYSCIAGFVNPGENLETAMAREAMEETGLTIGNIRYFASQHWPFPNSLMMGFYAEYLSGDLVIDYNELADAQWYSIYELDQIKLPAEISIARSLIENYKALYTQSN